MEFPIPAKNIIRFIIRSGSEILDDTRKQLAALYIRQPHLFLILWSTQTRYAIFSGIVL